VAETNPDIVYIGGGETQLRGSITQGDGVYKSIDGGKTWKHIGLSDTQAIARIRIHPTNPDIVYVAALGHPYGDNKERGIFRSRDGGETWEKILYKSPKAGGVDISIDRTNPKVIYASLWQVYRKAWKMWGGGPFSGIYKSTDGGDTWKELTNNSGMPEGPIGKIGMAVSPADPKRVWAVVEASEGGVFRSDDGGKNWERTNDDRKIRQRHFYYSRIVADPLDRETVYALNTRLYKSTDGGVTFDDKLGCIFLELAPGNLFVGHRAGIAAVAGGGIADLTEVCPLFHLRPLHILLEHRHHTDGKVARDTASDLEKSK
jgi:hypothetical protein